mmetsp:Transcript_2932/g.2512  ORF Transcript_2932/g.2512 Transcript_2932/m.2512 type:complete len:109 (+) Transcript_2932:2417-2743(+)
MSEAFQVYTLEPTKVLVVGFANVYALVTCAYMWSFLYDKALSAIKFYPVFYFFLLYTMTNIMVGVAISQNANNGNFKNVDSPQVRLATYLGYVLCPTNLYNNFINIQN